MCHCTILSWWWVCLFPTNTSKHRVMWNFSQITVSKDYRAHELSLQAPKYPKLPFGLFNMICPTGAIVAVVSTPTTHKDRRITNKHIILCASAFTPANITTTWLQDVYSWHSTEVPYMQLCVHTTMFLRWWQQEWWNHHDYSLNSLMLSIYSA